VSRSFHETGLAFVGVLRSKRDSKLLLVAWSLSGRWDWERREKEVNTILCRCFDMVDHTREEPTDLPAVNLAWQQSQTATGGE
jgi:hypothetical protein